MRLLAYKLCNLTPDDVGDGDVDGEFDMDSLIGSVVLFEEQTLSRIDGVSADVRVRDISYKSSRVIIRV